MQLNGIDLFTDDGRIYYFRFPDNSLLRASMMEVLLWEMLKELKGENIRLDARKAGIAKGKKG